MVARPAAVPRAREEIPPLSGELPDGRRKPPAPAPAAGLARSDIPFATPVVDSDLPPLDLSEFVFSETETRFQVEDEVDPVSYTHLDVYKRQGEASS